MKRNMDLIRELLLAIEKQHEYGPIYGLTVPGYSTNEIAYHCQLLYEHGFIDSYDNLSGDEEVQDIAVGGLTWEGADYLETVRDISRWGKVKTTMKEKGIPLTVDFVKETVNAMVAAIIGSVFG